MWGGGIIGVRFSGGSDNVVGSIDLFWGVPGMSSVSDVTSLGFRSLPANYRKGNGRAFPRNPLSEEMLAKLTDDLHNADKDL